MITLVEANNFRCLRYVRQELGRFHVLVGPNASGKTTFLDVIQFLGDLVTGNLDDAIRSRSENLKDLLWHRTGDKFELAIEMAIPDEYRSQHSDKEVCRYEIAIGIHPETQENAILSERVLLLPRRKPRVIQRTFFPDPPRQPNTIMTSTARKGVKTVISKSPSGNDIFHQETGKGWDHVFRLGHRRSALANLPEDEFKFPVSTALKRLLSRGVQSLMLNSVRMRNPSPPGRGVEFRTDGSNLPWVIEWLSMKAPDRKAQWVAHVRTALPDIEDIRTVQRPEDLSRYLVVRYKNGLEIPSWVLSDGTLRLLALTLVAYLPDLRGVFLIEEPENGIHPRAVETVFQSLSTVYGAQILLATHSPVILGLARVEDILCFARIPEGATDIVRGSEHPALRNWQGEVHLHDLYVAGVLG